MRLLFPVRKVGIALLVVVGIGLVGWRLLGIYSVSTYQPFLAPTRAFLAAGLAQDSVALVRQGADPAAVRWVLASGRQNAAYLRELDQSLYVGHGLRRGDTTLVLFGIRSFGDCTSWPLTVFFSGPPGAARFQSVTGGCRELGHGHA
jgi:hypothetical protein